MPFSLLLAAFAILTPAEQRGRQIYERGTTASARPLTASMGTNNSGIPGSILPCGNCHGHDGHGKPESGTVPSDITWDALTKPYGVTHPSGRTHPPYNERLFKRAITMGVDPAGNGLDAAMPRFQIYNDDFGDLISYVKQLGRHVDPGITTDKIRLGVLITADAESQVMREALREYFSQVNAKGGIFSRRVELSFTESTSGLRELASEQVFALIAGSVVGAEKEMAAVLSETGMPSVAVSADSPEINRYAFYLDDGRQAEIDALVEYAENKLRDRTLRIAIFGEGSPALVERLRKSGFENSGVAAAGADVAFVLRPGGVLRTGVARTYVAIADRDPRSKAIAAAEIMTEGLKGSGRSLSRETLLEAIEGIYRLSTQAGEMTFGPNRHIGKIGAHVESWGGLY